MNADAGTVCAEIIARLGLMAPEAARQALATWSAEKGSPARWLCVRGSLSADDAEHLDYFVKRAQPDQEDTTIDATPPPLARGRSAQTKPETSGSRYRLIAIHASGGMGRVWLAEDELMKRRVAVKELRPELGGDSDIRARFVQEIHVTARLEHPGIVPIHDFAQPPGDGAAMYVMRFIEGKTLGEEIKAYHAAGAADRLRLARLLHVVIAICQTVGFAHARGVLHRDLKPANVLLGEFGEVLVLDWGLAKLVGAPEAASSSVPASSNSATGTQSATEAGQVLGTPAYMAPEQAAGQLDRLDLRTDVFGIGAILYEVLTGAPPFARKDSRSQGVSARKANRDTPAALDAICTKALAAAPDGRYATAGELGKDLERWLADEPVLAYPEPWWQRVGRRLRRHKAVVAALAFVTLAILIALTTSTVLINQQRKRAEASLQTALDAVDSFLVKISEERLLYEPGMQSLRTELLRTARGFGEKFVAESEGDPSRQRDLARMLMLLGKSAGMSGDGKQALQDLHRARDIYHELRRTQPNDPIVEAGAARCQLEIGMVAREESVADAAKELHVALELLRALPKTVESLRYVALAEYELGLFYINARKPKEARPHLEQAIAVGQRVVQLDPGNWLLHSNLAAAHSGLGQWFRDQGNLKEAKTQLHAALEIRERLLAKRLLNPLIEDGVAQSYNNLGLINMHAKDFDSAERQLRTAFKHYQHLVHQNPAVPRYRRLFGAAHLNVGRVLWLRKQKDPAFEELNKGLTILETLYDDYPQAANTHELALAHLDFAYRQKESGKQDVALGHLQRAEKIAQSLPGDKTLGAKGRLLLRDVLWTRAQIFVMQRRFVESLQAYNEAIDRWDDGSAPDLHTERANIAKVVGK